MYVSRMGENNKALTLLAGQPEGKRPLEREKSRWEVTFILRIWGEDWIHLARDIYKCRAYANAVIKF